MKKKLIIGISAAAILIAAIITGVMLSKSPEKKNSDDINVTCKAEVTKDGDITCYEWLKKLCGKTSVEADDYRKAASDYGYITDNDEFNNDDIASGEFIALSAMRAMGESKMQIYLGTDDDISDKTNMELAVDKELIAEDSLNKGFSDEEADNVLDKFDELYYGEFWPDDVENVEYNDNVKQLEYFDIKDYKEDDNTIQLDPEAAKNLKKGDTIIFDYKGLKVSEKISEDAGNGAFSLENPEIEDVFDTLILSDFESLTLDDIIDYYGRDNVEVSYGKPVIEMAANVSGNIKSKGFGIEVSQNDNSELEVKLQDNNTGAYYKLPVKHRFKKKCENFSVKWDVNNISVGAQVKYTLKDGLKYASVGVDIDSEISSSIEGELSEGILICEIPKPIGGAAVSVSVSLYVVPELDGSLSLKAEIPFHSGVSYEKGKGTKATMGQKSSQIAVEAEGEMGLFFRTAPMVVAARTIPLIDIELDMGAEADGKITRRTNGQICSDISINSPVFKVSAGNEDVKFNNKKSLLSKMGMGLELKFDKIREPETIHYEKLPDGTKQYVKECTYSEQAEQEKTTENETVTEAPTKEQLTSQETDVKKSGSLNTYKTRLAEYYPEQTTFYFDYPNNWIVTKERVSSGEYVVLENENGAKLEFDASSHKKSIYGNQMYGDGKQYFEATVTPISKSRYNPGENFWIVKIKETQLLDGLTGGQTIYDDGPEMYAIIPEENAMKDTIGYSGMRVMIWCMFDCPNATLIWTPANGSLTDKDREEIIAILQSFRDTP